MKLATRISRISASQTMAVGEAALRLREQGLDVVDFGPGEPDFPTPGNIGRAGIQAIEQNFTKYTPSGGIRQLREAIAAWHSRNFGSKFAVEEAIANVGGKHAIFNVFSAVIDDGDDVIIPTPYWVSFADITRFVGANPVFAATSEENGFRLTASMLASAWTPGTRLVVVNSPNNPSGAVVDDDEMVRIAELCRQRGAYLLADECYCRFLYDGRKPFSLGSLPEFKETVVITGSLSKTFAMTGWRIGFILAHKDIIQAVLKLQSHSTSNPTSIAQKAAVEALNGSQSAVSDMLEEYAKRRSYVIERLRAIPGVRCAVPGGAFYAYPNVSSSYKSGIRNSVDFATRLLEEQSVAVVPGEAFGTNDHVRISYATAMEQLDKGLNRLEAFMKAHA